jgi:hypothetical protein
MARPEELKPLVVKAIAELGITVPIHSYEKSGRGVKLHLGNGFEPVTWAPKARRTKKKVTDG